MPEKSSRPPASDFRHRQASCAEPAQPVAPAAFGMRLWSARTCPRFGSPRHVASRKAMSCHRTPQTSSRQGTPEIRWHGYRRVSETALHLSPAHRAGCNVQNKIRSERTVESSRLFHRRSATQSVFHIHRGRCPRQISDAASRLCALALNPLPRNHPAASSRSRQWPKSTTGWPGVGRYCFGT